MSTDEQFDIEFNSMSQNGQLRQLLIGAWLHLDIVRIERMEKQDPAGLPGWRAYYNDAKPNTLSIDNATQEPLQRSADGI